MEGYIPEDAVRGDRDGVPWASGVRRRYPVSVIPGLAALADAVAINLAAALSYFVFLDFHPVLFDYYLFCSLFTSVTVFLLFSRSRLYDLNAVMRPISQSDFIISGVIVAILLFLTIVVSLKAADVYSLNWFFAFGASSIVLVTVGRLALARALDALGRRRSIGRALAVVGTGEQARRLLDRLEEIGPFFTFIEGVYELDEPGGRRRIGPHAVLGDLAALKESARRGLVDDVVIALPWVDEQRIDRVVTELRELPVNVAISTDLVGYRLAFRPVLGSFTQLPVFEVVARPISGWSSFLKAVEDYVLASAILLLLSPLLAAVAVAIRLDSPGPVLFKQRRLGFNNSVFWIYKFRSMRHDGTPQPVTQQATRDDPRITRVGRLIRRTSIDELPQLLNVLDGTMSLVGPRPHALDHNEAFGRQIRGYFARHKVKPGITGWAQVNGLRGETEALSKMEARVRHDVYYAENWSLLFDLRILLATAMVVLFQRNAY